MAKFLDLVEQNNAASFKKLFEETVADKVLAALDEAKKGVAVKMSGQMGKHVHHNPYKDNKSSLQQDVRGFIGQSAIPHEGGLSNPVKEGTGRQDVVGLNPDEDNKGPGMGGGFTNAAPVKHVSYMPKSKAGATTSPSKK